MLLLSKQELFVGHNLFLMTSVYVNQDLVFTGTQFYELVNPITHWNE